MAQTAAYKTSAAKPKEHQQTLETTDEHKTTLGEVQALSLPEQEYDGVVALGESHRVPGERLKRGMERLEKHGL